MCNFTLWMWVELQTEPEKLKISIKSIMEKLIKIYLLPCKYFTKISMV